jgi:glycosyltransferase involved in cell wall biosynthesis
LHGELDREKDVGMKVLHLVKTSVGGTWALLQAAELVRRGLDVHVALPPGPLVRKYEEAGVKTHMVSFDLPLKRPWLVTAVFSRFRDLLGKVQPDLIHSHFVGTTLTMRLALGRSHPTRRVFQVPGPLHLEYGAIARAELWTAGLHDYWIGSCLWTCKRYCSLGVPKSRVFLSYYGTDLEEMTPRKPGKLRGELRLGSEAKIVGMVAYMYPPKRFLGQRRGLKGHEDLIDALELCMERDSKIVGVFVGGAWNGARRYEEEIMARAKKKCGDRVFFIGTRKDVPELYADFNVAVHPSHSENVGGARESMLLGVPTVATSVGGFPDLVRDGDTGWTTPPHSPRSLADKIMQSLQESIISAEMAGRGRALARGLFDVRRTAEEVHSIYLRVLR